MIPKEFWSQLSPDERVVLESLETSMKARGMEISIEGDEIVISKGGKVVRHPRSFLSTMANSAKSVAS